MPLMESHTEHDKPLTRMSFMGQITAWERCDTEGSQPCRCPINVIRQLERVLQILPFPLDRENTITLFFVDRFPLEYLLNYHPLSENQMRKYGGTSLSCEDHLKSHIVSSSKFLLHHRQCALNTAVTMSSSYVNVKLFLRFRVDSSQQSRVKWLKVDTNFGRSPAGRIDVTSKM